MGRQVTMRPMTQRRTLIPCLALLALAGAAMAGPLEPDLSQQVQRLARDSASAAWVSSTAQGATPARVEVELGQLDPRLTLAPCAQIEPYLPAGTRLYGRTRIGLRCVQGPTRWNVSLPVTVKVLATSLVAGIALPAGTVLGTQHLASGEVDLAASPDPAIGQAELAVGRTLARPLAAGEALRKGDLKARHWFAAGEMVMVVAQGQGFAVTAEGQALGPGLEGQPARIRTESGRIVTGMPVAERKVVVPL